MAHTANEWLEKFEIKKPDYDYIERDCMTMDNVEFAPMRYEKDGDSWKSKKTTRRLFGRKKCRLMFVGDITCFEKQFEEAWNGENYDFSYEFEKIRPVFAEADLVVGNLETMIFPDAPYRTEKYVSEQNFHCNAPVEFLDAVRKAGIDVLTNANNHDMDTGAVGIGETIDYIERFGFIHTGTFKSEKKRYEIIDVDGFRIAVTAFATDHNNKKCNLTHEGIDYLLNDYSREKAEKTIREARKDGAELVFVCIHWGRENKIVQNKDQIRIANELVDLGYDCIIGSHPHVLQPFDIIKRAEKKVPVFYSMGNFISHNVNNRKARSIIACIDLERHGKGINMNCSYIPVFTSKTYGDKKYIVLPINERPVDPRNIRKKEQIKEIVGNSLETSKEIRFKECIEKIEKPELKKKGDKPDFSKVDEFPVSYDDGKFVYSVYDGHAVVKGISDDCTTSSYTVPLKVIDVPVSGISAGAFEGNKIMKKMNFKSNISYISERLFKDCCLLEGFQVGKNVIEIKDEAFSGCKKLTAAVMKNNVRKIGRKAFYNCIGLRSVKIPNSVTDIADDAFEGCTNAVFYCENDSYAEKYAEKNGFKIVNMELY